ncbi:MAG: 4-hydroxy-tetrahydrodipicolinate synthase [Puniceicoccales bacterium]|nr:4-hydroxy-tetrahydrodipicolinate synthase [Puniceicoccales bacterium]
MDALPIGVVTALVTPMRDGKLDEVGLQSMLERQISQKISAVVMAGTTGEVSTLEDAEYAKLLEMTVKIAAGRLFLMAGTGSNATATAIRRTQLAEKLGYDAVLVVAPYYNKPSKDGILAHYSAIATSTGLPIVPYSIPSRCGIEIALDTLCQLHERHPQICGLKEAGTDCDRIAQLRHTLGHSFRLYAGNDTLLLPFLASGADGTICAAANACPEGFIKVLQLALANDFMAARAVQFSLLPLLRALGCEVNPVPLKFVLQELGFIASAEVRAPLAPLAAANAKLVRAALQTYLANRA